jgi:hypothetical protein
MGASKRGDVEPTHDWQLLLPLFGWLEQERYEQIRPLMLFDASVAERTVEVGTSASTLYRRLDRFAEEGMESLFVTDAADVEKTKTYVKASAQGKWEKTSNIEDPPLASGLTIPL